MASATCAIVNFVVQDNATFQDPIQFGDPTDTSWSLTGMSFKMEVKASRDDGTPLVTWATGTGEIITDDVVQRVIHFNVTDTAIQASLPPAEYVYDFLMLDGSTPAIRTPLMRGKFVVSRGVTEN
jgi:hypothetical protein